MSTREQDPTNSRTEVAEILLAMSNTPPQAVDIGLSPKTPSIKAPLSSAASSPFSSPTAVAKISNSDDEDMDTGATDARREPALNRDIAPKMWSNGAPGVPTALTLSGGSPCAASAIKSSEVSRPQSVPADISFFVFKEAQRPGTAPLARNPFAQTFLSTARNFTPVNGLVMSPAPLSLIPPDVVNVLSGSSSSFVGGRTAHLSGVRSGTHRHGRRTPPQETRGPRVDIANASHHLQPRRDAMSETSRDTTEEAGLAYQLPAPSTFIPPVYMTTARPRVLSDGASAPVPSAEARAQGNASGSHLSRKRAVTLTKDSAAKRARDGFGSKDVDITDFKYRTMKVIQMPERNDFLSNEGPPQPTPATLPYGDEIDYHSSMLLWWLDELELTYTETARRYRAMFSGTSDTDDTVRKKHHVALIRLARKYGLKPDDQIGEPSKTVARRGQQAGHKYNAIGGKTTYAAGAGPDDAGKVRRHRVSEPTADRGFLKACICVWKDTSDVIFALIQQRLANEYGWHLGLNTVQKMYYDERKRVYDRYDKTGRERSEQRQPEVEQIVKAVGVESMRVAVERQDHLDPAVIQNVDR